MSRRATDWIVMDFKQDGAPWTCRRCGEVYRMNMPCSVTVYVAASKAFVSIHRYCRRRPDADHPAEGP